MAWDACPAALEVVVVVEVALEVKLEDALAVPDEATPGTSVATTSVVAPPAMLCWLLALTRASNPTASVTASVTSPVLVLVASLNALAVALPSRGTTAT